MSASFPRFYRAVKEMVRDTVLSTPVARDIVRRSLLRPGAQGGDVNLFGVPRGGKKGYALVKRSDEDFDCEWQPHGPYIYDWNEYLPDQWRSYVPYTPETPGHPNPAFDFEQRSKDRAPTFAVEPVPQIIQAHVHLNEDLRSGVDHTDAKGFIFDRWRHTSRVVPLEEPSPVPGGEVSRTWDWYEPDPDPVTDEEFFDSLGQPAPSWQYQSTHNVMLGPFEWGWRSMGINAALMRVRVQAYIADCSDRAFWSLGLDSTGVHSFITRYYNDEITPTDVYYLPIDEASPGYYDSGWIPVAHDYTKTFNGSTHCSTRLELRFYDFESTEPAIPFTEVQLVAYEFTDTYDWMYPRGEFPSR